MEWISDVCMYEACPKCKPLSISHGADFRKPYILDLGEKEFNRTTLMEQSKALIN